MWLEPDDSADRVDLLFQRAAAAGLGWIRLFLMWPWIETAPGVFDFAVWDSAFDAAARHGIRIKATLTANSGPWHIGTPALLHSHTGFLSPAQRAPMRRYIRACVERYAGHPALGQWILWNEPNGGGDRTSKSLDHWRAWLRAHYAGDIARLNQRWRTGFDDFAAVPFPEDIPTPPTVAPRSGSATARGSPIGRVARPGSTRSSPGSRRWSARSNPTTPCCVNPTEVLANQAAGGTDLARMGTIVETVGASYHPAWHFTFADRADFPALMVAGVRLEATYPTIARVEVTEVQAGNTQNSSHRPSGVTPGELTRFYLAGIVAGAEIGDGLVPERTQPRLRGGRLGPA